MAVKRTDKGARLTRLGAKMKALVGNVDGSRVLATIRCYIEGLQKAKESIPIEKETARLKLSVVDLPRSWPFTSLPFKSWAFDPAPVAPQVCQISEYPGGRPTRQLSRFGLLSPSPRVRRILQMILDQLLQVCREELRKAKSAMIAAYGIMRDADERALQTLLLFFQDR
jgi:hypothetical protein